MRLAPRDLRVLASAPLAVALIAFGFAACELVGVTTAAYASPGTTPPARRTQPAADALRANDFDPAGPRDPVTGEPIDPFASDPPANDPGVDDSLELTDPEAAGLALHPTRGPTIAAVLSAAYRAAGLDRQPGRSWVRRARWAGLLPWLTVRTGRNTSWQTDDSSIDHGMALDVRATWRLDRLVFDGRELQVASIEAARRRERRQLASHVIRVYFGWRRAVARTTRYPATRARALEAAAELDALTDGWFSEATRP